MIEQQSPSGHDGLPSNSAHAPVSWLDTNGRDWFVEASGVRILFRSEGETLDLPASDWPTDLSIQPHGSGYIIRVDRFDRSLGFFVSSEQAAPVLGVKLSQLKETPSERSVDDPRDKTPLLWPKVSRLAVASLCLSSLTLIPLLGVLPAIGTATMLILHRKRVRKNRAWLHSRRLCLAALILTLLGLTASAFSTWGLWRYWTRDRIMAPDKSTEPATIREWMKETATPNSPPSMLHHDVNPQEHESVPLKSASFSFQPFWERDHNWGLIVAGLVVILASLTIHEAAHAITAWWLGDDFARRLGRVTLNPLAHIDPVGSVMLPLMLFMAGGDPWGWARPVPSRPEVTDRPRRTMILVAIAGPVSNLLLASASLMVLLILGYVLALVAPDGAVTNFATPDFTAPISVRGIWFAPMLVSFLTLLKISFFINVFLAFFNLIPIPPLDGGWVLGGLFPRTVGAFYDRIRPYSFIVFLCFIYSDLSNYVVYPALVVILPAFVLLQLCAGI